jgi:hypothetical protein
LRGFSPENSAKAVAGPGPTPPRGTTAMVPRYVLPKGASSSVVVVACRILCVWKCTCRPCSSPWGGLRPGRR